MGGISIKSVLSGSRRSGWVANSPGWLIELAIEVIAIEVM
jgi:hypothetical protein